MIKHKRKKQSVSMTLQKMDIDLITKVSKDFGFSKSEIIRRTINFALKKNYSDFIKLLEEN